MRRWSARWIHAFLPEHHLAGESSEVVKTGSGLMATLTALVLGLLVSSAKDSWDAMNAGLDQVGAKVILLDRVLEKYGPEAKDVREQLRRGVARTIERLWPEDGSDAGGVGAVESATATESVEGAIHDLAPSDDGHRELRSRALDIARDVAISRWLLIEQTQTKLPTALLVALDAWLVFLFASIGLRAPRNRTVGVTLFVCGLCVSSAIFIILELNGPLDGLVKVSSAPLVKALQHLGR